MTTSVIFSLIHDNSFTIYKIFFLHRHLTGIFRLAWFTIRHEIRGEKKYNINTIGLNDLKKLIHKGDTNTCRNIPGSKLLFIGKGI